MKRPLKMTNPRPSPWQQWLRSTADTPYGLRSLLRHGEFCIQLSRVVDVEDEGHLVVRGCQAIEEPPVEPFRYAHGRAWCGCEAA